MVWLHMLCSLLSYGAFLVACIAAILFLLQERQLKRKRMGRLFRSLPALETLDRTNVFALSVGFALLSVGLLCGLAGTKAFLGRWWMNDAKEYLTVGLWAAYLALWCIRVRATLRGRRVAMLSVLGFGLVVLTFVGATYLLRSWHPYV